jgi:excinuclease ABC subunit B
MTPSPDEPATPEPAIPEAAISDSAIPESAISESAISESAISESAISESAISESAISESAISESMGQPPSPIRNDFEVVSDFQPRGDQPAAIESLLRGLENGRAFQTLLGVTGSGKTFTMAHVLARWGKPALVISHNKTLAAQLYSEFKEFMPSNAVEYFVSYYDYYQPEAYIPQRDIYIEKDAAINQDLDRLRLAATSSLMTRQDVVIVSSVSCLYGLGSPKEYRDMLVTLERGAEMDRDEVLRALVDIQYERHSKELSRGHFRVRGDVVEIQPAYDESAYRIEFFGDEIEDILEIHPLTGEVVDELDRVTIFPAKHFVASEERVERARRTIVVELRERLEQLREAGKFLEAERLNSRTRYDLELMKEVGYCPGIENYARHFSGREAGQRPYNLYDYYPDDFLVIVDESHVTIPQVRGMYRGDRSRKETLVEHGFRLPSALDNRPMRFEEWLDAIGQVVFVSATPGDYELEMSEGDVVELINRPTGLLDPVVEVRRATGQVQDLIVEMRAVIKREERVLVTALTKRMSEDLDEHFQEIGIRCRYLHSEVQTFERVEILQDLRRGKFDVVVGVNLLREGLDLPEVSLVAILDADKEGFLRSDTALIQTIGRAARNINSRVILYADRITDSMQRAMDETDRRRSLQADFNQKHGIVPTSIKKAIRSSIEDAVRARKVVRETVGQEEDSFSVLERLGQLEKEMLTAAEALDFEKAAQLRDQIDELRKKT